jgi:hypothetical protein
VNALSDHDLGSVDDPSDHASDAPAEGAAVPPPSPQLEAFILKRFSTTLEDPYTGRKL